MLFNISFTSGIELAKSFVAILMLAFRSSSVSDKGTSIASLFTEPAKF